MRLTERGGYEQTDGRTERQRKRKEKKKTRKG